MSPAKPEDVKLLGILVSRGMITPNQSDRGKKGLGAGTELMDVLQSTPLVEPLQFMKAQQIIQAQEAAREAPVERDNEGVNVVELDDDLELDFDSYRPTPVVPITGEVVIEKTPAPTDVAEQAKLVESDFDLDSEFDFHEVQTGPPSRVPLAEPEPEEPHYAKLDTDFDMEFESSAVHVLDEELDQDLELPAETPKPPVADKPIPLPRDSTGFIRPGLAPAVFDLGNDEGIAVIGQANHLLARVIEKKHAALHLRQADKAGRADYLGGNGLPVETEEMGTEAASKIMNRLKVMARIEPWRKTSLQGAFYMLDRGIEYTGMVESAAGEGEETLLVTIRSGRV